MSMLRQFLKPNDDYWRFFQKAKFGWVPEVAKRSPITGKLDEFRL
jgi:hypothetical protein